MSILSRYIGLLFFRVLTLCIGAFVAIYLVIDFLEKMRRFTRQEVDPLHILSYFIFKVPEIVNQVTPLGILMATLLTLGMLSRNSEITAMRSCGISIKTISTPILVVSLGVSLYTLLSNEFLLPVTKQKMQYVEEILIAKKSINTFFRQNNIWYRERNTFLQARLFEPSHHLFSGVTVWKLDGDMRPMTRIDAEKGLLVRDKIILNNAVERELRDGNVVRTITMKETPIRLGLKDEDLKALDKYAENMGFLQLKKYAKKLQEGGYDATSYLAQMHSKMSLPFASFVMSFLGIPFALRSGRSAGVGVGIGISLGIGFAYFVTNAVLLSLGSGAILPPLLAAWAANVLFASAGVWLAMTVNN